ncbi:MAG: 23S rRNA (guanosine(2251)-2'-O)-methyltransferase RlmB [Fluviicola sp.]|jgi:23S rRNA (guanosine2251-2'-O)-methyltransferase|nr:23S rRNA (guanosine(2251)-2'-O)-methyltransferase RlmB [Fluviicola sp.]
MENRRNNRKEGYGKREEYSANRKFTQRDSFGSENTYERRERKDSDEFIFGIRSVIEAIKAEREINKVMILKGINKDLFLELKDALAGKNYYIQYVPQEKLDKVTQNNHQGVIAYVSPISYHNIEKLVEEKLEKGEKPCILFLDRITDVRNFGAIARTAECEGVDAIVIPSRGSVQVTSDAIKTSAGALNRIPVCKSDNIKDSLFYLQQCGLRIVACTEKTNVPLYEVNLRGSVAIVMGSEEDGITSDILNMADIKAKIPMKGEISSLNVGVATGMVLYEKIRQELYG